MKKYSNNKNLISDSNISAGGNFNQGDGKQDNRKTTINIQIGKIAVGGGISILAIYLLSSGGIIIGGPNRKDVPASDTTELVIDLGGKEDLVEEVPSKKRTQEVETLEEPNQKLSDYVNISQNTRVAFLSAVPLKMVSIKSEVQSFFSTAGIQVSSNYFRPEFFSTFGRSIDDIDFGELHDMGLSQKINCICQIKENIEVDTSTVEEEEIWTARGSINILIYDLKSGVLEETVLKGTPRAGISKQAALDAMETYLANSEDLKTLNVSKCK